MVALINEHWVAYLLGLAYLLGAFCWWQSSLFNRRDWWLAFVVPVSVPLYVARRHPVAVGLIAVCVVFVWGCVQW